LIWRKTLPYPDMSLKSWTYSTRVGHSTRMRGIGKHPCDPSNLIHEAFRIEGIGPEECRAIFFDWAMGLDAKIDMVAAAKTLHADLAGKIPNHPMSKLLTEASLGLTPGRGRGGRRRGRRV
jgi:hypothetical protein